MANFFREPDRRQRFLLPVDMADWVPETDMVHLLLDVVAMMDLSTFERHDTKRGTGAPPFAPFGDARGDEMPADLREASGRQARLRAGLDRLRAEAQAEAARRQEKIAARAAEEAATGKKKHDRTPKPAEEGANEANDVHQLVPMIAKTLAMMETVSGEEADLGVGLFDQGNRPWRDVEPVFGQMKETQGADRFMMRGEEETKGEWSLHGSAHNVKKLHSESVRGGRKGGNWPRN